MRDNLDAWYYYTVQCKMFYVNHRVMIRKPQPLIMRIIIKMTPNPAPLTIHLIPLTLCIKLHDPRTLGLGAANLGCQVARPGGGGREPWVVGIHADRFHTGALFKVFAAGRQVTELDPRPPHRTIPLWQTPTSRS